MTTRKLCEPILQGDEEEQTYAFLSTSWGKAPSDPIVKAYDITEGTRIEVSTTVLLGDPSVSGDLITLPKIKALTAKRIYRIEILFSAQGDVFETYFDIHAEY